MTVLTGVLAEVDLLGETESAEVYLAALSWEAGYQRALCDVAARYAEVDQAWRVAGRRSWNEQVTARLTEMEADAPVPAWAGIGQLGTEERRALYRRLLATWESAP